MDNNNPTGKIQIFNNPQFGEIRMVLSDCGEPLFCLSDLAKVLELSPHKIAQRAEEGVLSKYPLETAGGVQMVNFVNEDGLYDAVLDSRKPEAKKFRRWITSEVLPSIRKDGGYMIARENETEVELLARAVIVAQSALERERTRREKAELQIEADKPKVTFAKAVESSRSSCLIGELAKILKQNGVEIGQNRLFEWLRKNHYLCTQSGQRNNPTQKAMESGLFEVKKRCVDLPNGQTRTVTTTVVTGKGQIYFVNKFLNNQNTEEK